MINQNHPERRVGEVFIGNFTMDSYRAVGYATKRTGSNAYDINSVKLPQHYDLVPVFVQMDEMKEYMETVSSHLTVSVLADWLKNSENIDENISLTT